MQALGKEWTKLVVPTQGQHGVQDTTGGPVPSMGSTMKVGSAPTRMPGLYVSSPIKAMSGNAAERRDETIFSTFLSASVTMSTAAAPSQSALFCSGTEQPKERRFEPVGGEASIRTYATEEGRIWSWRTVELGAGVELGRVGGEHHPAGLVGEEDHFVVDGLQVDSHCGRDWGDWSRVAL